MSGFVLRYVETADWREVNLELSNLSRIFPIEPQLFKDYGN